jgi:ppGpp synthetase/RelA/SpoT-type nucleotidyltranferase
MADEDEAEDETEAQIDASLLLELSQLERDVAEVGMSLAAANKSFRYALKPEEQRRLNDRIKQQASMKARLERLRSRFIQLQEAEHRAEAEEQFAKLTGRLPQ